MASEHTCPLSSRRTLLRTLVSAGARWRSEWASGREQCSQAARDGRRPRDSRPRVRQERNKVEAGG
eukprot:5908812-Pleurochrysis_carterae.AAC.2